MKGRASMPHAKVAKVAKRKENFSASSTFSEESFLINTQRQLGEVGCSDALTASAVFNSVWRVCVGPSSTPRGKPLKRFIENHWKITQLKLGVNKIEMTQTTRCSCKPTTAPIVTANVGALLQNP
jgi:hypothetical protein